MEPAIAQEEAVPEPSRWNELVGPFYSGRTMSRLLGGISRKAVAERRQRRTLLGLKTTDGVVVYPVFQLGERNRTLPGFPELLRCFQTDAVDDWTIAGWLTSPMGPLSGRSPVEWLQQGGDPAPVLALARDANRHFSQ